MASKPQDSSKQVLPWQVTMDRLICASLSHAHYWYEVGMLQVPAKIPGTGCCNAIKKNVAYREHIYPKHQPINALITISNNSSQNPYFYTLTTVLIRLLLWGIRRGRLSTAGEKLNRRLRYVVDRTQSGSLTREMGGGSNSMGSGSMTVFTRCSSSERQIYVIR